jgi:hypothetical protein
VKVPAPLLTDVDTPDDLELAREQFRIRSRYLDQASSGAVKP